MAAFRSYIIPALVCIIVIGAVLPIIGRYADDTNLIAYFNHDESFLMGLIWYYYCGEKGPYYQFNSDYGVGMLYIADLARSFLSKSIVFTPGRFVLIMRWLQLIFWVLSLLAVWVFARRHFGISWLPAVVVVLFASCTGLSVVIHSSKPDSIALFFTIVGLDHALRLLDSGRKADLIVALACAAIATVIKFSGIFLLPAVIVAVYLSARVRPAGHLLPKIRYACVLPAVIGVIFVVLPLASIFIYTRQSSGMTSYKEFGLAGSISRSKPIFFLIALGAISIISSALLYFAGRKGRRFFGMRPETLNEILSYSSFTIIIFVLFAALFGFKWLMDPAQFVATYSIMVPIFLDGITRSSSVGGSLFVLAGNFISKITEFNIVFCVLFIFYMFLEVRNRVASLKTGRLDFFKRVTLASFMVTLIPCMFFVSHLKLYHMMPFFIVSAVLIAHIPFFYKRYAGASSLSGKMVTAVICICFTTTIVYNSYHSFKAFKSAYAWREDRIFRIVEWWNRSYSETISIIADNPIFVYMPKQYKNARFLRSQKDRPSQLRYMVEKFKPRLVYYNTFKMPPIKEILPDRAVRLAADFEDPSPFYSNYGDIRYVVYEISY